MYPRYYRFPIEDPRHMVHQLRQDPYVRVPDISPPNYHIPPQGYQPWEERDQYREPHENVRLFEDSPSYTGRNRYLAEVRHDPSYDHNVFPRGTSRSESPPERREFHASRGRFHGRKKGGVSLYLDDVYDPPDDEGAASRHRKLEKSQPRWNDPGSSSSRSRSYNDSRRNPPYKHSNKPKSRTKSNEDKPSTSRAKPKGKDDDKKSKTIVNTSEKKGNAYTKNLTDNKETNSVQNKKHNVGSKEVPSCSTSDKLSDKKSSADTKKSTDNKLNVRETNSVQDKKPNVDSKEVPSCDTAEKGSGGTKKSTDKVNNVGTKKVPSCNTSNKLTDRKSNTDNKSTDNIVNAKETNGVQDKKQSLGSKEVPFCDTTKKLTDKNGNVDTKKSTDNKINAIETNNVQDKVHNVGSKEEPFCDTKKKSTDKKGNVDTKKSTDNKINAKDTNSVQDKVHNAGSKEVSTSDTTEKSTDKKGDVGTKKSTDNKINAKETNNVQDKVHNVDYKEVQSCNSSNKLTDRKSNADTKQLTDNIVNVKETNGVQDKKHNLSSKEVPSCDPTEKSTDKYGNVDTKKSTDNRETDSVKDKNHIVSSKEVPSYGLSEDLIEKISNADTKKSTDDKVITKKTDKVQNQNNVSHETRISTIVSENDKTESSKKHDSDKPLNNTTTGFNKKETNLSKDSSNNKKGSTSTSESVQKENLSNSGQDKPKEIVTKLLTSDNVLENSKNVAALIEDKTKDLNSDTVNKNRSNEDTVRKNLNSDKENEVLNTENSAEPKNSTDSKKGTDSQDKIITNEASVSEDEVNKKVSSDSMAFRKEIRIKLFQTDFGLTALPENTNKAAANSENEDVVVCESDDEDLQVVDEYIELLDSPQNKECNIPDCQIIDESEPSKETSDITHYESTNKDKAVDVEPPTNMISETNQVLTLKPITELTGTSLNNNLTKQINNADIQVSRKESKTNSQNNTIPFLDGKASNAEMSISPSFLKNLNTRASFLKPVHEITKKLSRQDVYSSSESIDLSQNSETTENSQNSQHTEDDPLVTEDTATNENPLAGVVINTQESFLNMQIPVNLTKDVTDVVNMELSPKFSSCEESDGDEDKLTYDQSNEELFKEMDDFFESLPAVKTPTKTSEVNNQKSPDDLNNSSNSVVTPVTDILSKSGAKVTLDFLHKKCASINFELLRKKAYMLRLARKKRHKSKSVPPLNKVQKTVVRRKSLNDIDQVEKVEISKDNTSTLVKEISVSKKEIETSSNKPDLINELDDLFDEIEKEKQSKEVEKEVCDAEDGIRVKKSKKSRKIESSSEDEDTLLKHEEERHPKKSEKDVIDSQSKYEKCSDKNETNDEIGKPSLTSSEKVTPDNMQTEKIYNAKKRTKQGTYKDNSKSVKNKDKTRRKPETPDNPPSLLENIMSGMTKTYGQPVVSTKSKKVEESEPKKEEPRLTTKDYLLKKGDSLEYRLKIVPPELHSNLPDPRMQKARSEVSLFVLKWGIVEQRSPIENSEHRPASDKGHNFSHIRSPDYSDRRASFDSSRRSSIDTSSTRRSSVESLGKSPNSDFIEPQPSCSYKPRKNQLVKKPYRPSIEAFSSSDSEEEVMTKAQWVMKNKSREFKKSVPKQNRPMSGCNQESSKSVQRKCDNKHLFGSDTEDEEDSTNSINLNFKDKDTNGDMKRSNSQENSKMKQSSNNKTVEGSNKDTTKVTHTLPKKDQNHTSKSTNVEHDDSSSSQSSNQANIAMQNSNEKSSFNQEKKNFNEPNNKVTKESQSQTNNSAESNKKAISAKSNKEQASFKSLSTKLGERKSSQSTTDVYRGMPKKDGSNQSKISKPEKPRCDDVSRSNATSSSGSSDTEPKKKKIKTNDRVNSNQNEKASKESKKISKESRKSTSTKDRNTESSGNSLTKVTKDKVDVKLPPNNETSCKSENKNASNVSHDTPKEPITMDRSSTTLTHSSQSVGSSDPQKPTSSIKENSNTKANDNSNTNLEILKESTKNPNIKKRSSSKKEKDGNKKYELSCKKVNDNVSTNESCSHSSIKPSHKETFPSTSNKNLSLDTASLNKEHKNEKKRYTSKKSHENSSSKNKPSTSKSDSVKVTETSIKIQSQTVLNESKSSKSEKQKSVHILNKPSTSSTQEVNKSLDKLASFNSESKSHSEIEKDKNKEPLKMIFKKVEPIPKLLLRRVSEDTKKRKRSDDKTPSKNKIKKRKSLNDLGENSSMGSESTSKQSSPNRSLDELNIKELQSKNFIDFTFSTAVAYKSDFPDFENAQASIVTQNPYVAAEQTTVLSQPQPLEALVTQIEYDDDVIAILPVHPMIDLTEDSDMPQITETPESLQNLLDGSQDESKPVINEQFACLYAANQDQDSDVQPTSAYVPASVIFRNSTESTSTNTEPKEEETTLINEIQVNVFNSENASATNTNSDNQVETKLEDVSATNTSSDNQVGTNVPVLETSISDERLEQTEIEQDVARIQRSDMELAQAIASIQTNQPQTDEIMDSIYNSSEQRNTVENNENRATEHQSSSAENNLTKILVNEESPQKNNNIRQSLEDHVQEVMSNLVKLSSATNERKMSNPALSPDNRSVADITMETPLNNSPEMSSRTSCNNVTTAAAIITASSVTTTSSNTSVQSIHTESMKDLPSTRASESLASSTTSVSEVPVSTAAAELSLTNSIGVPNSSCQGTSGPSAEPIQSLNNSNRMPNVDLIKFPQNLNNTNIAPVSEPSSPRSSVKVRSLNDVIIAPISETSNIPSIAEQLSPRTNPPIKEPNQKQCLPKMIRLRSVESINASFSEPPNPNIKKTNHNLSHLQHAASQQNNHNLNVSPGVNHNLVNHNSNIHIQSRQTQDLPPVVVPNSVGSPRSDQNLVNQNIPAAVLNHNATNSNLNSPQRQNVSPNLVAQPQMQQPQNANADSQVTPKIPPPKIPPPKIPPLFFVHCGISSHDLKLLLDAFTSRIYFLKLFSQAKHAYMECLKVNLKFSRQVRHLFEEETRLIETQIREKVINLSRELLNDLLRVNIQTIAGGRFVSEDYVNFIRDCLSFQISELFNFPLGSGVALSCLLYTLLEPIKNQLGEGSILWALYVNSLNRWRWYQKNMEIKSTIEAHRTSNILFGQPYPWLEDENVPGPSSRLTSAEHQRQQSLLKRNQFGNYIQQPTTSQQNIQNLNQTVNMVAPPNVSIINQNNPSPQQGQLVQVQGPNQQYQYNGSVSSSHPPIMNQPTTGSYNFQPSANDQCNSRSNQMAGMQNNAQSTNTLNTNQQQIHNPQYTYTISPPTQNQMASLQISMQPNSKNQHQMFNMNALRPSHMVRFPNNSQPVNTPSNNHIYNMNHPRPTQMTGTHNISQHNNTMSNHQIYTINNPRPTQLAGVQNISQPNNALSNNQTYNMNHPPRPTQMTGTQNISQPNNTLPPRPIQMAPQNNIQPAFAAPTTAARRAKVAAHKKHIDTPRYQPNYSVTPSQRMVYAPVVHPPVQGNSAATSNRGNISLSSVRAPSIENLGNTPRYQANYSVPQNQSHVYAGTPRNISSGGSVTTPPPSYEEAARAKRKEEEDRIANSRREEDRNSKLLKELLNPNGNTDSLFTKPTENANSSLFSKPPEKSTEERSSNDFRIKLPFTQPPSYTTTSSPVTTFSDTTTEQTVSPSGKRSQTSPSNDSVSQKSKKSVFDIPLAERVQQTTTSQATSAPVPSPYKDAILKATLEAPISTFTSTSGQPIVTSMPSNQTTARSSMRIGEVVVRQQSTSPSLSNTSQEKKNTQEAVKGINRIGDVTISPVCKNLKPPNDQEAKKSKKRSGSGNKSENNIPHKKKKADNESTFYFDGDVIEIADSSSDSEPDQEETGHKGSSQEEVFTLELQPPTSAVEYTSIVNESATDVNKLTTNVNESIPHNVVNTSQDEEYNVLHLNNDEEDDTFVEESSEEIPGTSYHNTESSDLYYPFCRDVVDLTVMDDEELDQIQRDLGLVFVKKEDGAEPEQEVVVPENPVAPSPADSGIASPPIQDMDPSANVVNIEERKLCRCGQPAQYNCVCELVWYCGENCQLDDWEIHKSKCSYEPEDLNDDEDEDEGNEDSDE